MFSKNKNSFFKLVKLGLAVNGESAKWVFLNKKQKLIVKDIDGSANQHNIIFISPTNTLFVDEYGSKMKSFVLDVKYGQVMLHYISENLIKIE